MKIDELKAYAAEFELDIIGITETWLNEGISNCEIAIENFTFTEKTNQKLKGGAQGEQLFTLGIRLYHFHVRN